MCQRRIKVKGFVVFGVMEIDTFALRIYIEREARTQRRSLGMLGRREPLAQYLRERALEAGIGDVQLYEVLGGYLALAPGQVERTDGQIPDCLEIVGSKDALQTFVDLYRPLLGSRHIVLLTHQESKSCARWPPGLV